MKNKTPKVIFDLGGVVFDWNPERITQTFLETLSLTPEAEQQLAATLKQEVFAHTDWLETDRGTLSDANAAKRFAARTGRSVNEMEQLLAITNESLRPFPETLQLIEDLSARGIPLYVLSNMPRERGAYLLKSFDFWNRFEGIVLSGDIQLIKPDAAIYEYLLTTFGLQAADCAFLDDSMPNITAANELGIHGIHVERVEQYRPHVEEWLARRTNQ